MAWADAHVYSTLAICWGAQAELYYHYGIGKHTVDGKVFGVFAHEVTDPKNKITRGFDGIFLAPHSRHTTVTEADILAEPDLELLARSPEVGVYLAASRDGRRVFVTGHPEYDGDTLDSEYRRDLAAGLPIDLPHNYYPEDDPDRPAPVTWRAHGDLLFTNWLNYCVYQETPYDLHELVARGHRAADEG
jgi:homoserine O-succinyltransferase